MHKLIRTWLGSVALVHWTHQDHDTFPKVDMYNNLDGSDAQEHWIQSLPIDFSPFKPQNLFFLTEKGRKKDFVPY